VGLRNRERSASPRDSRVKLKRFIQSSTGTLNDESVASQKHGDDILPKLFLMASRLSINELSAALLLFAGIHGVMGIDREFHFNFDDIAI
jgi:hypothetical protein